MLGWVVTFLVIALIAGILGFGGIAGASIEIPAKGPLYMISEGADATVSCTVTLR